MYQVRVHLNDTFKTTNTTINRIILSINHETEKYSSSRDTNDFVL